MPGFPQHSELLLFMPGHGTSLFCPSAATAEWNPHHCHRGGPPMSDSIPLLALALPPTTHSSYSSFPLPLPKPTVGIPHIPPGRGPLVLTSCLWPVRPQDETSVSVFSWLPVFYVPGQRIVFPWTPLFTGLITSIQPSKSKGQKHRVKCKTKLTPGKDHGRNLIQVSGPVGI